MAAPWSIHRVGTQVPRVTPTFIADDARHRQRARTHETLVPIQDHGPHQHRDELGTNTLGVFRGGLRETIIALSEALLVITTADTGNLSEECQLNIFTDVTVKPQRRLRGVESTEWLARSACIFLSDLRVTFFLLRAYLLAMDA